MNCLSVENELDTSYELSDKIIQDYEKWGVVKLKNVLSEGIINELNTEVTKAVLSEYNEVEAFENAPSETYAKAFQQIMNIWVKHDSVKKFVFSKRLAKIACELLQTKGVRLYHDQALYKAPGGGHTPWHADQYYWPLSNKKTCTIWIPLQPVPLDMAPLSFAKGSHKGGLTRDDGITEESDDIISKKVKEYPYLSEAFDMGEVSFHSGSLYHNAGENNTTEPRKVMTMIYMDSDMRMAEPINDNQQADAKNWLPGVRANELCDSVLNPILYSK